MNNERLDMPIEIIDLSILKYTELLQRGEVHFLDFKSKGLQPQG